MDKRIIVLCALGVVAGPAHADPVDLEALSSWVTYAREVELGQRHDLDHQTGKRGTEVCLEEVDAALKSGSTRKTVVNLGDTEIPGATQDGDRWSASIASIERYCKDVRAKVNAAEAIWSLESTLAAVADTYQMYFVDGDDPGDYWWHVEEVARSCPDAVDAAIAAGVGKDQVLNVRDGQVTLGQAKATYCDPLTTAVEAAVEARRKAEEARLAPFKKALAGDKLDLVLSRGTYWFGKRCKVMNTAKQLAKAKVWYEILIDTSGIEPRWTTRAYKFKGNRHVSTKERSGWGSDPPSKGCP